MIKRAINNLLYVWKIMNIFICCNDFELENCLCQKKKKKMELGRLHDVHFFSFNLAVNNPKTDKTQNIFYQIFE